MALGPRLEFRQSQTLVMTPQLRQAIKLLQYNNIEVAAFVEQELERNPLLERDERAEVISERPALDQQGSTPLPAEADIADHVASGMLAEAPLDITILPEAVAGGMDDQGGAHAGESWGSGGSTSFDGDDRDLAETLTETKTLRDHLAEQLRLNFTDRTELLIGAHLIALLDEAGRLSAAPAVIAAALGVAEAAIEAVRAQMMRFDPVGLFARDLSECLAVQLAEKNRLDPAMALLLDHLELLARRDFKKLSEICGVDREDLTDMLAEIRALDPKPGSLWAKTPLLVVIPDVLMRAAPDGVWRLELNPETLPRVLVSEQFAASIMPARSGNEAARETKLFLSEKLAEANWLVKSLHQRAETILKVSAEIVRRQEAFFTHGVSHLRPLILRDIADEVQLHESTVSRVTANKYIATPRGMFELKYFFTTAIAGAGGESHSAEAVRHRIKTLVGAETAENILSDDALVVALQKEGIDIARRTVAKYREALRIPSSVQRKRDKVLLA
jgi:RNA polymerase sigma-54 factor